MSHFVSAQQHVLMTGAVIGKQEWWQLKQRERTRCTHRNASISNGTHSDARPAAFLIPGIDRGCQAPFSQQCKWGSIRAAHTALCCRVLCWLD